MVSSEESTWRSVALGGLLWHVRFLRESFRIVCGVYARPRSIELKSQCSQEIKAMALSEAEGLGSLIWSGLKRGQPASIMSHCQRFGTLSRLLSLSISLLCSFVRSSNVSPTNAARVLPRDAATVLTLRKSSWDIRTFSCSAGAGLSSGSCLLDIWCLYKRTLARLMLAS